MAVINRVRVGIPSTQRATCCSVPTYTRKKPLQTTPSPFIPPYFNLSPFFYTCCLSPSHSLFPLSILSSALFVHFCFLPSICFIISFARCFFHGRKKIIGIIKDSNFRNCLSLRRIAVIKYTSSNLELCGIGVNVYLELERFSVPLRRNCIPFVASYLKQIVSQIVLIISLSLSRPFLSTFVTV